MKLVDVISILCHETIIELHNASNEIIYLGYEYNISDEFMLVCVLSIYPLNKGIIEIKIEL